MDGAPTRRASGARCRLFSAVAGGIGLFMSDHDDVRRDSGVAERAGIVCIAQGATVLARA